MPLDDTPADPASARAQQRLAAWAAHHRDAARLASLAALAVRVDAPLLRRLRLHLLPRAEPGIEADVWHAPLHASAGGGSLVFDAAVQRLLRADLLAMPVPEGQPTALQAAWAVTRSLHADWPEALRTEEELTLVALAAAPDATERIGQLLQPALTAMATGGEARALEVARWLQRALPRLPDLARQHPSALALWLGALVRLGAADGTLPASGDGSLPPALRWLLPGGADPVEVVVDVQALSDGLRLAPRPVGAPPAPLHIRLPATQPLLLGLAVQRADGSNSSHTAVLQGETNVPLPADWQWVDLHSLAGSRWRLQRQAQAAAPAAPLAWQQARVQVLGPTGAPVGLATFVSPSELVTVVDALPPALVGAVRGPDDSGPDDSGPGGAAPQALPGAIGQPLRGLEKQADEPVALRARDDQGRALTLSARLRALDLRSALALLVLDRPAPQAVVAARSTGTPAADTMLWTPAGLHAEAEAEIWHGSMAPAGGAFLPPAGRPAPDSVSWPFPVLLPAGQTDLQGMAGAPVFQGDRLVGLADLMLTGTRGNQGTVWAIPAPAIDRFLRWARLAPADAPQVVLLHPVQDAYGKGAEIDEIALQRLQRAAWRARVALASKPPDRASQPLPRDQALLATVRPAEAALRLVTPVTDPFADPADRLLLQAVAARRWAQPDFAVLALVFRCAEDRSRDRLPVTLRTDTLQDIERLPAEPLARQLLDAVDPPGRSPLLPQQGLAWLEQQARALAATAVATPRAMDAIWQAAAQQQLDLVADRVTKAWTARQDGSSAALVDLLAQAALPIDDPDLLLRLQGAPRGVVLLHAMPVQLARLLIARANAGRAPPAAVVLRDFGLSQGTADSVHQAVCKALATAAACSADEAALLLGQLELRYWVIVAPAPLPDPAMLAALQRRLPGAGFLLLGHGAPQEGSAEHPAGIDLLRLAFDRDGMPWVQSYKQLMQWARPRRQPARRGPHKPLPK